MKNLILIYSFCESNTFLIMIIEDGVILDNDERNVSVFETLRYGLIGKKKRGELKNF